MDTDAEDITKFKWMWRIDEAREYIVSTSMRSRSALIARYHVLLQLRTGGVSCMMSGRENEPGFIDAHAVVIYDDM